MSARVLLVEDEPGLVLTLTDRLTAEGYGVERASDGDVALERATREAFDVILLDVMLPGGNGFDVLPHAAPAGRQTPILMLTARGQVVDRVVGLKLGADDYLTKPFEMMELLARIEALLRRRAAERADAVDRAVPVRRHPRRLPQGRGDEGRPAGRALGARVQAAALFHRASRRRRSRATSC